MNVDLSEAFQATQEAVPLPASKAKSADAVRYLALYKV